MSLTRLGFLKSQKLFQFVNVYDQFLFIVFFSHVLLDSLKLLGIDFLIILANIGFLFRLKCRFRDQMYIVFPKELMKFMMV